MAEPNRNHFIPFRRADVAVMCAEALPEPERRSFLDLATMVSSVAHYRFFADLEALKDAYHPFNPESDTRTVDAFSPEQRLAAQQRLESELEKLARAANFSEITEAEVHEAFEKHSLVKVRLDVDTSIIDKVLFFRRGESVRRRTVPALFGLRKKEVEFTNYSRVLVYARFKHDIPKKKAKLFTPGSTVVKLFQNVPQEDLEMVFPNVRVRMRGVDRATLAVPALFSFGVVAIKLAPIGLALLALAAYVGLIHRQVDLPPGEIMAIGAGLVALGGFGLRQFNSFKNRQIKFMKTLADNLYFRNLDNDAGVFHNLVDAAEEAEVIETVLAYHFLRTNPGITQAELDHQIEAFFAARWSEKVDYEVEDGLRKLRELTLLEESPTGALSVVDLDEAKRRLDHAWDNIFTYNAPAVAAAIPAQPGPTPAVAPAV